MFKFSAKSKEKSEPLSSTHSLLEAQNSNQNQPKAESSPRTKQPQSTLDCSVNQESDDATKPDLDVLVEDLRTGMSTISMKSSGPMGSHASTSSNAILDEVPRSRISENRDRPEFQAIASRIVYHPGPFSYGTRRFPDKRLNRSYATRQINTAEREARRAALDIVEQRRKESEARILARQRKLLQVYSDPRVECGVEIAWPLVQYATRRSDGHPWPMLFFDITRDPCDPTAGAISLRSEGNQKIQEGLLSECMKLEFSPITKFSMIKLRGSENGLERLGDVMVNRLDGIRVIDVFSAIFKAYNVPLTLRETFDLRDLLNSSPNIDAYRRRSRSLPIQDREVFRVDLLGKNRIFNGISFDEESGQFHFHLIESHPEDISLTVLC